MTPDPKALRAAFGRFMTGVTVVTTRANDGTPLGFTANSFTSVSLNPPLVLVCPGNHLSSFDTFASVNTFGISVLAEGQEDVSNRFASGTGDRFATTPCDTPMANIPLITGRAAGFVCDVHDRITAGDHMILIGHVRHFDDAALAGLGYGPDGYFNQSSERTAEAPQATITRASALLEDGSGVLMTGNLDLPGVDVPAGQSPLQTLRTALKAQQISANLSVVYAIYDAANRHRQIVFRGRVTGGQSGLETYAIDRLAYLDVPDAALKSLLNRFAIEHETQSFGLYVGNETEGDVLPAKER